MASLVYENVGSTRHIHALRFSFIWYSTQTHHKQYRSFEYTAGRSYSRGGFNKNILNAYAAHVWMSDCLCAMRRTSGLQRRTEASVRLMGIVCGIRTLVVPMSSNACCVFYAALRPTALGCSTVWIYRPYRLVEWACWGAFIRDWFPHSTSIAVHALRTGRYLSHDLFWRRLPFQAKSQSDLFKMWYNV